MLIILFLKFLKLADPVSITDYANVLEHHLTVQLNDYIQSYLTKIIMTAVIHHTHLSINHVFHTIVIWEHE